MSYNAAAEIVTTEDAAIAHAFAPLDGLTQINHDDDVCDALRAMATRARDIGSQGRQLLRLRALDRLKVLRPHNEWSDSRREAEVDKHLVADGGDRSADTAWPDLVPLGNDAEPTRFPLETLPSWLRDWVDAVRRWTQTPVDMAAMMALAVIASACQRRFIVRARDGWSEQPSLYVAVAMAPGSRKSAVVSEARAPLDSYERDESVRLARDIAQSEDAVASARKRLDRVIAKAADASSQDRVACDQDLREARTELTAAERCVVRAPRLVCADITQESLALTLAQHGECMALIDAEGSGPLSVMAGRYSDGQSVIDLYLRAHAGDSYRSDRLKRESISLVRPALSMALAIQPDVLHRLGARPEWRGAGLLARFLFVVPTSTVGRRSSRSEPMSERARDAYASHLRVLLDLPRSEDGQPHVVQLSAAADAELRGFMDRLEPQLGAGGELFHLADWASKLAGTVMRIAGVLHAAEHVEAPWLSEVSEETMRRAVAIGDYLLAHARTAFGVIGADPVLADARHVVEWLIARKVRTISRRDLYRGLRPRFARPSGLEPVLLLLTEAGWIREHVPRKSTPQGRRPSPMIEVSPRALEDKRHGHNGHDGQNQIAGLNIDRSVHSVQSVQRERELLEREEDVL